MKRLTVIILSICILIFIASAIYAGDILLSSANKDAKFEGSKAAVKSERAIIQKVTFDCGGKNMYVTVSNKIKDVENYFIRNAKSICNKNITNIIDSKGNRLKQNDYGMYSFNETKLNINTCYNLGMVYDSKKMDCVVK